MAIPIGSQPAQAPVRRVLAEFLRGEETPKIDLALTADEYQGISEIDAARMMGWFTQKMQDKGFPWSLAEPVEGRMLQARKGLGELEALSRLRQGKPVLFQPKRSLQLDLSSESIGALATVGTVSRADLSGVESAAALSRSARVTPGSQGVEVKFGAPVVLKSFAELKLLHQMYNPEGSFKPDNPIGKAAHQLTYFTQKTLGGAYPWRFFEKSDENAVGRVLRAAVRRGAVAAAVGAGIGAMIGGPVGLFTGSWVALKALATVGAAVGGAFGAVDAARVAAKGNELNAVQTLERVLEGRPVTFQETQMRSVGVPILGKISWFSDHGKGSEVASAKDLETFCTMQDQDAKPPEAPAAPAQPEAPAKGGKTVPATLTIGGQDYQFDLTPVAKKPAAPAPAPPTRRVPTSVAILEVRVER